MRNLSDKIRAFLAARGVLRPAAEKVQDHADRYLPEIQKRSRRRRRRWWRAGILCLMLLVVVGGTALVFYSPVFQVQTFRLQGAKTLDEEEVWSFLRAEIFRSSRAKGMMGPSNILVWPDRLPPGALDALPGLERIEIRKDFWNRTVTVTVAEREVFGTWCYAPSAEAGETAASRCFWFDRAGVLAARSPFVVGRLILRVDDSSDAPRSIGAKILPPEQIAHAFSVFRVLRDSGVEVESLTLADPELQELHVALAGGPKFYFSLRFDAGTTFAVLESFQNAPDKFGEISYIDFRVENRAYYK